MMTISNGKETMNPVQSVHANMSMQSDSVSKGIQDQIMNAQKQLQELGMNKEMTPEEKMKKRQEIQQEIASLNQQLRQHQIEKRKEQQTKNAPEKQESKNNQQAGTAQQSAGLSSASMQAMMSADSSMKQAKVQGSVATQMEDRAGVLKIEIKLDGSRGGDTSAKKKELADVEQKAENAANAQLNTLAEANQTMEEASRTEQTDEKTDSSNEKNKTDQIADDKQQTNEISPADSEKEETKKPVSDENAAVETAGTDLRPAAQRHIDIRL